MPASGQDNPGRKRTEKPIALLFGLTFWAQLFLTGLFTGKFIGWKIKRVYGKKYEECYNNRKTEVQCQKGYENDQLGLQEY